MVSAHVFRGFMQRFHMIELLQMPFEIQMIALLQRGKEAFLLGLLFSLLFLVKILETQLLFLFIGQLIETDADQSDRALGHLVQQLHGLPPDRGSRRRPDCTNG